MTAGSQLRGSAVVVTGAGRGLGRAFALACAAEGARVVVNDVDADEAAAVVGEITGGGGEAVVSGHSVADWDAAGDLVDACVKAYGRIDGLVNNAVTYPYYGDPSAEGGDTIRHAIEVNVMGAMFCGVQAMRRMQEQRSGSVVNLTSRAMLGIPGAGTYAATKGALASMTYSWALDMAPHGVRVNALAPAALTRGHQLAGAAGSYARSNAVEPERIAPAVVYLLSDDAAGVNGQIIALIGTKLGVVRPAEVVIVAEQDAWSASEIGAVLGEHRQPVGLPDAVQTSSAASDIGAEGSA